MFTGKELHENTGYLVIDEPLSCNELKPFSIIIRLKLKKQNGIQTIM